MSGIERLRQELQRPEFIPAVLLISIILLGGLLRVWGISFGLPGNLLRPDEEGVVNEALWFLRWKTVSGMRSETFWPRCLTLCAGSSLPVYLSSLSPRCCGTISGYRKRIWGQI